MNKMKYTNKFIFIGAIFLFVLLLIAKSLLSNIKKEIEEIDERKAGTQYSLLLKNILQSTQRHRGTSVSYINGDTSVSSNLQIIKSNMNDALQKMNEFEKPLQYDFKVGAQSSEINKRWREFESTKSWSNANHIVTTHRYIIVSSLLKNKDHSTGSIASNK